MNKNSLEKTEEQKRIREEFMKLYADFPFKYSFWESIIGTSQNMFLKKMSDSHTNRYYHFTKEELDKAKAYLKEKALNILLNS